jgi:hypothetical protein
MRSDLPQPTFAALALAAPLRYLTHAIPLLVLASARGARWRRALGFTVAVVSGVFVLSTISPDAFGGPLAFLARPEPLAVLCLAWLLAELVAGDRDRDAARRPAHS